MFGKAGNEGIIPRAASQIFDAISTSQENREFSIKASFLEIYLEQLRDLLNPTAQKLSIREDKKRIWVENLSEEYVSHSEDVLDLIAQGEKLRATSSTKMNETSSRSHSVLMLRVMSKDVDGSRPMDATLNLIDLAGSERVGKTGATGQTLAEAQKINKSLSALGNVINALAEGKDGHIPYRDSQLTRLLQQSLGGNCKTRLIVACSPAAFNSEETLSSLRFGARAKTIVSQVHKNEEKGVEELKKEVKFWKNVAHDFEKTIKKLLSGATLTEEEKSAVLKQTEVAQLSANSEIVAAVNKAHESEAHTLRLERDALVLECDAARERNEAQEKRILELTTALDATKNEAQQVQERLQSKLTSFGAQMESLLHAQRRLSGNFGKPSSGGSGAGGGDLSALQMELLNEQTLRKNEAFQAAQKIQDLEDEVRRLRTQMEGLVPREELEALQAENAALKVVAEIASQRKARLFRPLKGGAGSANVKAAMAEKLDLGAVRGTLKSAGKQLW